MSRHGRAPHACPVCFRSVAAGEQCPEHGRRKPDPRQSPADRGYDRKWRMNAARFLAANPVCALCTAPSTHADHHPQSRRELTALGVTDPDAWRFLRPLCESHHNSKSAKERR